MSRSQLVAEHLPLLRRYARALTGNQASGDAYVGAMLEALLQDPSLLDEQHGPRAGLFRLFTQIWNSVSLNDNAEVATLPMPPERRLSNITPLPRQAFLLLSLEGFSEEEVAFILGTDIAETRRLADAAGREMAAEIATDVLIIEDETFIAMDLESLVRNLGHNVIGVARTHSDAVALAKNKKPGLILADIQLADGSSGLDAVNELLRVFEVPVVFITAYPARFAARRIFFAAAAWGRAAPHTIRLRPHKALCFRTKSRARLASPQPRPASPVNGAGGITGCRNYAQPRKSFPPPTNIFRHG